MDASGRWKKEGSKRLLRGRAMRERARERVRPPRQPEGPGSEPRQQHGVSGFGVRQCRHRERGWGDLGTPGGARLASHSLLFGLCLPRVTSACEVFSIP